MSLVFVLYLCHGPAMSYGFDNVGRSNEGTKSKHPPRVENCGNDPWWIACRNGGYIPPNIPCRSDAKSSFDGRWVRHCDANSTENRILVLGAAGLHGSDALSTFFGACVVSFSSVRCPLNVVVTTQNVHPTSTSQPQQWLGQESRIGPQSTSCWARFRTVTACGFKTCWELGTSALFFVLGREFPLERAGTTAAKWWDWKQELALWKGTGANQVAPFRVSAGVSPGSARTTQAIPFVELRSAKGMPACYQGIHSREMAGQRAEQKACAQKKNMSSVPSCTMPVLVMSWDRRSYTRDALLCAPFQASSCHVLAICNKLLGYQLQQGTWWLQERVCISLPDPFSPSPRSLCGKD